MAFIVFGPCGVLGGVPGADRAVLLSVFFLYFVFCILYLYSVFCILYLRTCFLVQIEKWMSSAK